MGLFAPKGTPKAIIDQIGEASHKAMSDAAVQKTLLDSGFRLDTDSNAEKLAKFIDYDMSRWGPLVKEIGVKVD